MSLRKLVEGECGGVNPLMQLGNHFTRDATRREEIFSGRSPFETVSISSEDQLVNEFIGEIAGPQRTFQMNALLQEMREIEQQNFQPQVVNAPRVIDEVSKSGAVIWKRELQQTARAIEGNVNKTSVDRNSSIQFNEYWEQPNMINVQPVQQTVTSVREFFDINEGVAQGASSYMRHQPYPAHMPFDRPYMRAPITYPSHNSQYTSNDFITAAEEAEKSHQTVTVESWIDEFEKSKDENEKLVTDYNEKFWQRLQNEWQKMAESENSEHPWLSEYSDLYDPYKEYSFVEENPMSEIDNVFEKGKEFLAKGDIPSAVLCFEAAVKKEPNNAEIWELLGTSQAENEMDPQSIAALKKSLELNPNNMKVLMSLAVSYTNESLQSHALKMLTTWLKCNPKYKNLVTNEIMQQTVENNFASSLIRGPHLKEIQNLFLEAVKQNPSEVDPDVQEALGVLFNLSSEFDKAVDCFNAALQVRPDNAKIWNRLGASLANGSRSVEAVEAYQRALQIEPGFIRVRYNVGVCCMNLKAYKQAGEHLLTALNMQATSASRTGLPNMVTNSSQQMSESIWSTLKMVISLMGRSDLHEHINQRNLEALNEAFKE